MHTQDQQFIVYRASAGSGKTYTLTLIFLRFILLGTPHLFRRVLALTFTNKAAAEMKSRILQALQKIASGDIEFTKNIAEALQEQNLVLLQTRAREALALILHEYGEFSIGTIDQFVHRVIRAFATEMGLHRDFEVSLDSAEIWQDTIDLLLWNLGKDEDLTQILVDYCLENLAEEKSWQVRTALFALIKSFKAEDQHELQQLSQTPRAELHQSKQNAQKYIATFKKEVQAYAQTFWDTIQGHDLQAAMNSYVYKYFEKLYQGSNSKKFAFELPSESVAKKLQNGEILLKAQQAQYQELANHLCAQYAEYSAFLQTDLAKFNIAQVWQNQGNLLLLLQNLQETFESYKARKRLLPIEEFNEKIARILAEEPVPFIYEKIGERYQHYLIDEFQDTSLAQWANLVPLFENSLAKNNLNLIVGDAKQAIYRWRGGDARQFIEPCTVFSPHADSFLTERLQGMQAQLAEKTLDTNWRSLGNIVEFNNWLFDAFTQNPDFAVAKAHYAHARQKHVKQNGYVFIQEMDKTEPEETLQKLLHTLQDLQNRGYAYQDIALLFRDNKTATAVAQFLLGQGIPVMSSESLLLKNEPRVLAIVSYCALRLDKRNVNAAHTLLWAMANCKGLNFGELLMQYTDPKDHHSQIQWEQFLQDYRLQAPVHIGVHGMYSFLVEIIYAFDFDSKNVFLDAFLQFVQSVEQKEGSNLLALLLAFQEKQDKLTAVFQGDGNAVQILSIHKSKGLEFPVVILPHFSLSSNKIHEKLFWVDNPFGAPEKIFMRAKKENESLAPEFFAAEKAQNHLDDLNLMYVAFTRAEKELHVFVEPKTNTVLKTLSALIASHPNYQTANKTLAIGEPVCQENKTKASPVQKQHALPNLNWQDLRLPKPSLAQRQGDLLHRFLSLVQDAQHWARDFAIYAHALSLEERQYMQERLEKLFAHADFLAWFAPCERVWTERALIDEHGELHIPDRVVFQGNTARLVDFKTGQVEKKHLQQVARYKKLLQDLGYEVTAFIFYTETLQQIQAQS